MSVAGNRESFRVSESETSGGLRLEATASGRTGDIEIDVNISSVRPLDEFLPESLRAASIPGTVSISPTGLVRMRNSVRSLRGRLVSRFGFSRSTLSKLISISSPSRRDLSFSRDLDTFDTLPFSFSESVSFQPAVVPEVNGSLERLPNVPITVTVTPTGVLTRFTTNFPSVELELPPEAFVATVPLSDFNCGDLFSNIETDIDRLNQSIVNEQQLEDDLDELKDVRSEILSASGIGSLPNLTPESLAGAGSGRLDEWRSRVRQTEPDPIPGGATISSLQSKAERLETTVDEIDVSACSGQFSREVDSIQSRLDNMANISRRVENLRRQILDNLPSSIGFGFIPCIDRDFGNVSGESINSNLDRIESDISNLISLSPQDFIDDIRSLENRTQRIQSSLNSVEDDIESIPPDNECRSQFMSRLRALRSRLGRQRERLQPPDKDDISDLDCSDVAQFIKNSVASAEQQARSFSNSRAVTRTPDRFGRVRSSINDAKQQVRQKVSGENPCQDQLLGRLDSAESLLERSRPPEKALSCEAQFSSIADRLDSFEDDVLALDPPVDSETFELMVTRADNLIQQVEREVPEDRRRCIKQFTRRIDGAVNRVGRVGARARIVTVEQLSKEEIDKRQEVINELENRLSNIEKIERPNLF